MKKARLLPSPLQEVVDLFGGVEAVAEVIGSTQRAMRSWPRIGVPHKHHATLLSAAAARGKPLTHEMLLATKPKKSPQKLPPVGTRPSARTRKRKLEDGPTDHPAVESLIEAV